MCVKIYILLQYEGPNSDQVCGNSKFYTRLELSLGNWTEKHASLRKLDENLEPVKRGCGTYKYSSAQVSIDSRRVICPRMGKCVCILSSIRDIVYIGEYPNA